MNNPQHKELIGLGIYTLPEASLYGTLSPNKLSRWVFGTTKSLAVIESQLADEHLISFYDLVQAKAINKAREAGVSLHKIRQAILYAKKHYSIELPLAYEHKLWLFENELHIKLPNKSPIQTSGHQKGQSSMEQIIEPFIKDLTFDIHGLVTSYIPYRNYGRSIILDPKKQFGQPLVENTGYRADVLNRAYLAENSYDSVANEYGLVVDDIKIAVDYMAQLKVAA